MMTEQRDDVARIDEKNSDGIWREDFKKRLDTRTVEEEPLGLIYCLLGNRNESQQSRKSSILRHNIVHAKLGSDRSCIYP